MESENTKISNKKSDSTNNVVAQETSTKIQVEDVSEGKKEDVSTTENSEETAEQKTSQEEEVQTFPIFIETCTPDKLTLEFQVTIFDSIQDLRSYLLEAPETCHITSYSFYFEGNKLNDFAEISAIPNIQKNSKLEMHEEFYDERSIKLHIRRISDILGSCDSSNSPSFYSFLTGQDGSQKFETSENDGDSTFLPDTKARLANLSPPKVVPPPSFKDLSFSNFNPPPGYRKLAGDLIYLEVNTLEGKLFHITGWTNGFYVNSSTSSTFNPIQAEKSYRSHNLVDLLSNLSPLFKKNYEATIQMVGQKNSLELFPIPFPVYPWVAAKERHTPSFTRAQDSLIFTPESEMRGQFRDWNEEYQNIRELPRASISDRIQRDRLIYKFIADFVEVATRGACLIIDRTIPPINPIEPERAHMFIYNNIFYSYALDGREYYKEYGGDRGAYIAINNDLKGIRALNRADIPGIHTLATAIIDYRGYRLVAQSIIPGILQREHTANIFYGSIDNGKKVNSDPEFHKLFLAASDFLFLKEHTIIDNEKNHVKLCSSVEVKGIRGTDDRCYFLDLVRLTPRDCNYSGKENTFTTLRPELLLIYNEHLQHIELQRRKLEKKLKEEKEQGKEKGEGKEEKNKEQEKGKEKEKNKSEEKEKEKDKGKKTQTPTSKEGEQKTETNETKDSSESNQSQEEGEELPIVKFNPNVFCDLKLGEAPEEIKQDEDQVKLLSKFLVDVMIPQVLDEFSFLISLAYDGPTLTSILHSRGINLRYLGLIASGTTKTFIRDLAIREMVTRASKHILRAILKETPDHQLSSVISHFLNCLLGKVTKSVAQPTIKRQNATIFSVPLSLTSKSLMQHLSKEVLDRYKYELPSLDVVRPIVSSVSTLRSICQKVGIQLNAKDYDLNQELPFQTEDILNLFPVVKHVNPETEDGNSLLEAGKSYLSQGRIDLGYEFLNEALTIFHNVYGPMHRSISNCYSNLALVMYQAKDTNQAMEHQQKATIICERVLGLDHPETANCFSNLGLFAQNLTNSKLALRLIKHSLYLQQITSGFNHPEVAATMTTVANMLQEMQKYEEAIVYLNYSLKSYEIILGKGQIQLSSIYHMLAIAHSQIGKFKEALDLEKKNYNILINHVGEDDIRVIEASIWLKQFTAKAVQSRMESFQKSVPTGPTITTKPTPVVRNAPTVPTHLNSSSLGTRDISELMAYINSSSKTFKPLHRHNKIRKYPQPKQTQATPQLDETSSSSFISTSPLVSVSENTNGNGHPTTTHKPKNKKKTKKGGSNK